MSLIRSRLVSAVLSLAVPGLGQLARGDRAKGVALLCMTGLLWVIMARSPSELKRLLYGVVYLCILIPAVQDAARPLDDPHPAGLDRPWYVVWMLLVLGPFALPLLWQSQRFSRRAKLCWTLGVILTSLLVIAAVEWLGPMMEQLLGSSQIAF